MQKQIALTVFPACGRDYSSREDVLSDWDNNKDFKIRKGPYVNKQQVEELKEDGFTEIQFIFNSLNYSFKLEI